MHFYKLLCPFLISHIILIITKIYKTVKIYISDNTLFHNTLFHNISVFSDTLPEIFGCPSTIDSSRASTHFWSLYCFFIYFNNVYVTHSYSYYYIFLSVILYLRLLLCISDWKLWRMLQKQCQNDHVQHSLWKILMCDN